MREFIYRKVEETDASTSTLKKNALDTMQFQKLHFLGQKEPMHYVHVPKHQD